MVRVAGRDWPVGGAQLAIVDGERVLLQFRPWPPGWELPGGHCDVGELPEETAAREAREETGYDVRATRLVGVYTWSGLRRAGDAVYLGEVTGGHAHRSVEAWAVGFFGAAHLPRTTFPWVRQRALDALAAASGVGPVHRTQPVTLRHVLTFATAWLQLPVDALRRRRASRR